MLKKKIDLGFYRLINVRWQLYMELGSVSDWLLAVLWTRAETGVSKFTRLLLPRALRIVYTGLACGNRGGSL